MANPRLMDIIRGFFTSVLKKKKTVTSFAGEKEEELLMLKAMIEDGRIRPVVDKVFPLEQAAEAHIRVETEQRSGPVVLSVNKK